jgi:hypothetical protein
MSLPVAVAVIVLADVALIGLLAFVMSHAKLLTPHASDAVAAPRARRPATWAARSPRRGTTARTPLQVRV